MATLEQAIKKYISKTARYDGRKDFKEDIEDVEIIKPVELVIDGEPKSCIFKLDVILEGKLGTEGYHTYWDNDPGEPTELEYVTIVRIHDIATVNEKGQVIEDLVLTRQQEDEILAANEAMLEQDGNVWDACERYLDWIEEQNQD